MNAHSIIAAILEAKHNYGNIRNFIHNPGLLTRISVSAGAKSPPQTKNIPGSSIWELNGEIGREW